MKKIEIPMPIDPGDQRYRQCLHCGYEFMTAHMARKFCSNHCHDHFHVNKRQKEGVQQVHSQPLPVISDTISRNLSILRWLPITEQGMEVDIGWLLSFGFSLAEYDQLIQLDERGECFGTQVGEFQLYWTEPQKILIYKPTNNQLS